MKQKTIRTLCAIILCVTTLLGAQIVAPFSAYAAEQSTVYSIAADIINWKKSTVGSNADGYLMNDGFLSLAGTTPGDWYPIGFGRLGIADNQTGYLAVINETVQKRYQTAEKLDRTKATEWHRISLAVLASGGDPRHMGANGEIDLIADGTYNRGLTASPGRQGINGWIWGLIALDSKRFEVPSDAVNTREDFIVEILRTQRSDGGFALTGEVSDVDITAMAIQALAPYYNTETVYFYTSSVVKTSEGAYAECSKTVREVIDESVAWLSSVQCSDGDFSSWGMQNVESTAQVLVALSTLGVDALHDSRFIKNGNTVLDGILKYRLSNGGFVHSFTYDPDNPTSLPDQANTMASEQVLYALVSLWRYQNGMRSLYDMREEFSITERLTIDACISTINLLDENSSKADIEAATSAYCKIPTLDRCYVNNYAKLATLAKEYGVELPKNTPTYNGGVGNSEQPLLYFSESNKASADALPSDEELTTEHFATVTTLRYILSNSEDFEGKQAYIIKLDKAYNRILGIQAEIDALKTEIKEKLYPFDSISLADRKTVHGLYDRYMALSEYDRSQFEPSDIEGLLKSKTQVDNLYLAVLISGISVTVAVIVTVVVIYRIKKRRKERAMNAMPESEE